MGFNIGKTGIRTPITLTKNIAADFEKRRLETRGSINTEYVVQKRAPKARPDRIAVSLKSPFNTNEILITKNAVETGLFTKALSFFVSPQAFRIALDTKMFHFNHINASVPFEIDGTPFIGDFYSRNTGQHTWHISLYNEEWELMGKTSGSGFAYDDLKTAQRYIDLARPF